MTKLDRTFRVFVSRTLLVISLFFTPLALFAATPLDINTAPANQFESFMSGVGAKKAEAIIAYRDANGHFESVDQLTNVKGIGDALLARNRDLIQVAENSDTSQ